MGEIQLDLAGVSFWVQESREKEEFEERFLFGVYFEVNRVSCHV